jgi:hypothetical protein
LIESKGRNTRKIVVEIKRVTGTIGTVVGLALDVTAVILVVKALEDLGNLFGR